LNKLLVITEQTLWQIIGRVITSGASFLALGLIIRNYSQEEVGVFTLAQTYLSMFFIIADLGLNAYVLSRLKDYPEEANKLFNARFYWSCSLVLIACLFSLLLPIGDGLFKMAVVFGAITIIGNGIFSSLSLIFQNQLKFELSIIAHIIGSAVMIITLFSLVFSNAPVFLLLLAYSIGWIANNITGLSLIRKFFKFKLITPDYKYFFGLLKKTWPISTTLILNVIYFRFDAFILAYFKGLSDAAIYNLSFALFQTALFLPTFVMNSYYPIILKELDNKKLLFRQLRLAFGIMTGIALLGTFFTFLSATVLVNLITGGGFEGSITSIKILSIGFPAFFGSALLMWVLVSLNKYKELMGVYFSGLVVNVVLNLIYTPRFTYIATSWITVFSEYLILSLLLMVLWFSEEKK